MAGEGTKCHWLTPTWMQRTNLQLYGVNWHTAIVALNRKRWKEQKSSPFDPPVMIRQWRRLYWLPSSRSKISEMQRKTCKKTVLKSKKETKTMHFFSLSENRTVHAFELCQTFVMCRCMLSRWCLRWRDLWNPRDLKWRFLSILHSNKSIVFWQKNIH